MEQEFCLWRGAGTSPGSVAKKSSANSRDAGPTLEKEMATPSSILAWEISWTEEPGGLWSMGSQKGMTE